MGNGTLENTVQNRRHLHNVELCTSQTMNGQFQEPSLEQFDRGCYTKKQSEGDTVFPGADHKLALRLCSSRMLEDLLEDCDQVRQKSCIEGLAVLEGNDYLFRLMRLNVRI